MDGNGHTLIPAPLAAARLGITPASFRNALWRSRQGLPGRPVPRVVRIGGRVYIEPDELDAFIESQKKADPGDPREVLEDVAAQIDQQYPEQADRLRALARGRSVRLLRGAK